MTDTFIPPMLHIRHGWREDAAARARKSEQRSRNPVGPLLERAYQVRALRGMIRRVCGRLEGSMMMSETWRRILRRWHGAEVGRYSYGSILSPRVLPAGSVVGSYCSVGCDLIVRRRDHPIEHDLLHPFFYNSKLGYMTSDMIMDDRDNPLTIGHDVWIGDRVTILSGCRNIGNGAVVAAGAVVTRDVPPYTVVGGTPAKVIRRRFDEKRAESIEATRWWNASISEIARASVHPSLP